MRRYFLPFAAAISLSVLAILSSFAHTHMAPVVIGNLEISASWARVMLPGQPTGGGYLTITNKGSEADHLVTATSPVAGRVEIHSMEIVNDVMTMRPVDGALEILAGASVELKPGGLHLMFMEVSDSFDEGETVKITLQFERAGIVDVDLPVMKAGGHAGHGG